MIPLNDKIYHIPSILVSYMTRIGKDDHVTMYAMTRK
jgi:hypothetical protein